VNKYILQSLFWNIKLGMMLPMTMGILRKFHQMGVDYDCTTFGVHKE
jgi:hypothetical protein